MKPAVVRRTAGTLCLAAALVLVVCDGARAQSPPPDPAEASPLRFGPLGFKPVLNVKNIGIDTNVFNEPENPKRDVTATVSPASDVYLRAGRLHVDLRVVADFVYYRDYASERSTNAEYSGLLSVPSPYVTPFAAAEYVDTRARPGFEVDARARHTTTRYRAGSEFRIGARTTFGVEAARAETRFDDDEVFRGVNLSAQLDRTERVGRVTFKEALTPLTRAIVSADVQSDRFVSNTERDADSVRVDAGLEFEPVALVSGRATVGYRRLEFLDPAISGNRGLVTAVNVGYTMFALTRLGVTASRDTQYSYEAERPYYIQTGATVVLTQGLFERWDVQAQFGRQNLAYADRAGNPSAGGTDRVTQYGGGAGCRLGATMRIGVNVVRNRRTSPDPARRFEGLQVGTSITYGT